MYTRGPLPSKRKTSWVHEKPCSVDLRIRSDLWGYRRERFHSHEGPWPDWWWQCYVTPRLYRAAKRRKGGGWRRGGGGRKKPLLRSEEQRVNALGVTGAVNSGPPTAHSEMRKPPDTRVPCGRSLGECRDLKKIHFLKTTWQVFQICWRVLPR